MTISLYDVSVGSFLQTVSGVECVLKKGAEFAEANGINPDTYVGLKVHESMLPMLFQIVCIPLHSIQAIRGVEEGVFSPPKELQQTDYAGLQKIVSGTKEALKDITSKHVNSLAGKPVIFKMGDLEIPFTAENFIMSFSLPNLNFHAATAYDLLRSEGVPLEKVDFLGKMRVGF